MSIATLLNCHYCLNDFRPTVDNTGVCDTDEDGHLCCDDCYCADCTLGHVPGAGCPREDIPTPEYPDPDAVYDRLRDQVLGL